MKWLLFSLFFEPSKIIEAEGLYPIWPKDYIYILVPLISPEAQSMMGDIVVRKFSTFFLRRTKPFWQYRKGPNLCGQSFGPGDYETYYFLIWIHHIQSENAIFHLQPCFWIEPLDLSPKLIHSTNISWMLIWTFLIAFLLDYILSGFGSPLSSNLAPLISSLNLRPFI